MDSGISFGEFIRKERLKKGITLRKFAQAVDLSSTFISRMERDDTYPPSEEKILNIAASLGLDPDYLILMARKVPKEVQELLFDKPHLVGFLRKVSKKSVAELDDMTNTPSKGEH